MKTILIAGGSGLVGQRIVQLLDKTQYRIHILSRSKRTDTAHVKYFQWDIAQEYIDPKALEADYLINLTGAGIADQRWTAQRKKELISSRVESTMLIVHKMKELGKRFRASANASAIGFYGDRADELLNESSVAGVGFLAECCQQWEAASHQMASVSDANHIIRVGIVLSTQGGALPKILMTEKIGVFNYFGDGKQYYSWIHIDDISQLFIDMLDQPSSTTINGVSPLPLTNKDFVTETKNALGKGFVLPAPAFAMRIALGEMSDVVLNSNRVVSEHDFFEHRFPDLQGAIKDLKKRVV